jgi:hypothetical protein
MVQHRLVLNREHDIIGLQVWFNVWLVSKGSFP